MRIIILRIMISWSKLSDSFLWLWLLLLCGEFVKFCNKGFLYFAVTKLVVFKFLLVLWLGNQIVGGDGFRNWERILVESYWPMLWRIYQNYSRLGRLPPYFYSICWWFISSKSSGFNCFFSELIVEMIWDFGEMTLKFIPMQGGGNIQM